MNTDDAVTRLLQAAAELTDEVRALRHENRRLKAGSNRKKLTRGEAERIRQMYRTTGWSQRQIAELFDVNRVTVSRIIRGDYWKG